MLTTSSIQIQKSDITGGISMNTDLIKFVPINTMISSYQMAIQEVDKAFDHLAAAKKHLKDIYGDSGGHRRAEVMKANLYYGDLEQAAQQNKQELKKTMWGFIIEKTQVRNLLTEKKSWNWTG
jgi:hypothetical protein